ncbi:phosphodiester glycosidase family protein [Thiorhodococcus minor]|uniref:Phosphodiester glycosidase family protein n=1 Tax=Thiorhodococcus minor TaxID=57489 RepID=A0A6M0JTJ1_9GAMM|nr:phosphodiester glycosidase family protein [Thiorhodococcus minor]NEV60808.1 phosphodiester glycosidase family protein [Thiorhodococcus minor]
MALSRSLLLPALLLWASGALADVWQPVRQSTPDGDGRELFYAKRTAVRQSDGKSLTAHLAVFASPAYRLKVIDLGGGESPKYASLDEAFRAEGCVAGANGGFFHPDWQPLGLVVSDAERTNGFARAKLLSGVVYSDGSGTHLMRRGQFRDHAGINALLQTGPYLVETGRSVRGLSTARPSRRTFIATDWRGHWALGATTSSVTLAELADVLASEGALTGWRVNRAINLDGGSSTGFFFAGGSEGASVVLSPWKRVRNLLGVVAR